MKRLASGSFDAPPSWRDDLSIRMATSDLRGWPTRQRMPFPGHAANREPHGVEVLVSAAGEVAWLAQVE
jgi:hypothetical protein